MLFIYTCALLMDMMWSLVVFAVLYGAGERRVSPAQCAWMGAAGFLGYMLFSVIAGRILSRRNARAILLLSAAASVGAGAWALFCTGFLFLFVLLLLLGAFTAFFFNSFQTYMRGESPPGGLGDAIAGYTVAWSMGLALGFLLSGSAYRFGPAFLAGMTALTGLIICASVLLRRPRPHSEASADEHVEHGPAGARPVDSRYVLVGWVMIFAACFALRPIQTFFPASCAEQGITPWLTALPLFLMTIVQAGVGFGMKWLRTMLYHRTALWLVQAGGVVALALPWAFPSYPAFLVAFPLVGVYLGFVFFCAVYYASNDFAHRSRNVGINECLVGAGSLLGIFTSETWMTWGADQSLIYPACAGAVALLTALQIVIASLPWRGKSHRLAPEEPPIPR